MKAIRKIRVGLTILFTLFVFIGTTVHAYNPSVATALQNYDTLHKVGSPVNASGADLRGAHLAKLQMPGVNFAGISAQPCQVNAINKNNPYNICNPSDVTNMSGSDFSGGNLQGANFFKANLSYVNLSHANAAYVSFKGANLAHANVTGLQVMHTTFDEANLKNAQGLDTLHQMQKGAVSFCHAIMPDGMICKPGKVWQGKVACNCPAK